jgi:hypothetical protein
MEIELLIDDFDELHVLELPPAIRRMVSPPTRKVVPRRRKRNIFEERKLARRTR